MHLQLGVIGVLVALSAVTCQTTAPRPALAGAPTEPGLALSNFEYQYGNAVLVRMKGGRLLWNLSLPTTLHAMPHRLTSVDTNSPCRLHHTDTAGHACRRH